jgi:uncharacterized protein YrrD
VKIDLGKDVIANDGEKIGTVDRLVLDNETHNLIKFVVHKGVIFSEDRIVDIDMISKIDSDGNVHVSVASDDERSLPPFVEDTYRVADEEVTRHLDYGTYTGTAPYAPIWMAPGGAGGTYRPGEGPFFQGAEATSGTLETRSNLPEDSFTIDEGTEVVGSDGNKVGEVHELVMDEHGNPTGFVVKSGFIFTHDVEIPIEVVERMSSSHVQLNITSDEAENRYGE